jgi:hypothetical protein
MVVAGWDYAEHIGSQNVAPIIVGPGPQSSEKDSASQRLRAQISPLNWSYSGIQRPHVADDGDPYAWKSVGLTRASQAWRPSPTARTLRNGDRASAWAGARVVA